jgi:hypothetical protein
VEVAIKKPMNKNTPGMDLIWAELVKYSDPEYIKDLHQLTVKIWITKQPQRNGIWASYALSIRKVM